MLDDAGASVEERVETLDIVDRAEVAVEDEVALVGHVALAVGPDSSHDRRAERLEVGALGGLRRTARPRREARGGCRAAATASPSSTTMISRRLAWATIFSWRSAPPPPLTRFSAGSTSSAPSIVTSIDGERRRRGSSAGCRASAAAAALAIDVGTPTIVAAAHPRRGARRACGSRRSRCCPVPRPTVMPDSTQSTARSPASCFSCVRSGPVTVSSVMRRTVPARGDDGACSPSSRHSSRARRATSTTRCRWRRADRVASAALPDAVGRRRPVLTAATLRPSTRRTAAASTRCRSRPRPIASPPTTTFVGAAPVIDVQTHLVSPARWGRGGEALAGFLRMVDPDRWSDALDPLPARGVAVGRAGVRRQRDGRRARSPRCPVFPTTWCCRTTRSPRCARSSTATPTPSACSRTRSCTRTSVSPSSTGWSGWRDRLRPSGWKVYTLWDPPERRNGRRPAGFFLDDEACGFPFLERVRDVGPRLVCAHKGIAGPVPDATPAGASPRDIGPAAAAFPEIDLVVYHSGYDLDAACRGGCLRARRLRRQPAWCAASPTPVIGPGRERVGRAREHLVPHAPPTAARPRTCSASSFSRSARTASCGAPTRSGTDRRSRSSTRSARSTIPEELRARHGYPAAHRGGEGEDPESERRRASTASTRDLATTPRGSPRPPTPYDPADERRRSNAGGSPRSSTRSTLDRSPTRTATGSVTCAGIIARARPPRLARRRRDLARPDHGVAERRLGLRRRRLHRRRARASERSPTPTS